MSRTLFVVLAVLALILSVSAQSSTSSSSSSSSSASPLSSSSSYVTASSSTGARSSSSSGSSSSSSGVSTAAIASTSSSSSSTGVSSTGQGGGGGSTGNTTYVSSSSSSTGTSGSTSTYPANSLAVSLYLTNVNPNLTVTQQVNATLWDIAYNLANELSPAQPQATPLIVQYLVMTSYNGQSLAPASRRLLQTQTPITFIILGNITQLSAQGVTVTDTNSVATAFQTAAQNGALVAPYSGATIPQQTPTVVTPGQGSTGGASVVASAGAALIAAAVASLALLL